MTLLYGLYKVRFQTVQRTCCGNGAQALTVGVPAAGTYTLLATDLTNLPAGLDAFLTDAATGRTVNLRTQPSYAFAVTAAQTTTLLTGRFTFAFGARTALAAAEVYALPQPGPRRVRGAGVGRGRCHGGAGHAA